MTPGARSATRVAQALMSERGANLAADGYWGSFTNNAFIKSAPGTKAIIRSILRDFDGGYTPESLFLGTRKDPEAKRIAAEERKALDKGPLPMSSIPASVLADSKDVRSIVVRVAKEYGMSEASLIAFAKIESNFNAKAISPSGRHFGVMQMSKAAWADALEQQKRLGKPTSGSFETGKFNAEANVRAGAAYIGANRRFLDSEGYTGPWDVPHWYLAHQQGFRGLATIHKLAKGGSLTQGQAKFAKADMATNMKGNPPQDQKGVTTNPAQFYERWVNVAQDKYNNALA